MRIIGGEARGRPVRLPGGCTIRPTADRVKKSLFDILGPVAGETFVDVFAGSGNVGLEALSRGAGFAFFVESQTRLAAVIRTNLDQFGYVGRAEVIARDAERGIAWLRERGERVDVVFADPPYDEGFVSKTLLWLASGALLKPGGLVVMQHSAREMPEGPLIGQLSAIDQRSYGDTVLSFFTQNSEGKAI
jgi:16S rRNA (guanine(966)-N(2))-methyltransferase RsmD